MLRNILMASAFVMTVGSTAVFAQNGNSGGQSGQGDNSEVTFCRTKIEQAELKYKSGTETMPATMSKLIDDAKAAMAAGNPTKCLSILNQIK